MQNFGGLNQAFGPGVTQQLSRQMYLRRKYPELSLEEADRWDKDRRRRLTVNEITLARSIYASAIRYERVSIYQRGHHFIPTKRPHAPDGSIYFPTNDEYEVDFGTASITHRSTFIHEMCHVWQHQRGVVLPLMVGIEAKLWPRRMKDGSVNLLDNHKNYVYAPMFKATGARSLFMWLDTEAQAEFMRDYYLVKNGYLAMMEDNRGFSRAQYEAKLPPSMRAAGVGAAVS